MAHVCQHKLPYGFTAVTVVVDGVAPVGHVPVVEVLIREFPHVIAVRPKMVVDDVENHAQPGRMGTIDETAKPVAGAVTVKWCEPTHPVVPPAKRAREFGNGHDLEDRDAELRELAQVLGGRGIGAVRGERADVQLVNDGPAGGDPTPCLIGPSKLRRIDDQRRAVRPVRLIAGGRVGKAALSIQTEPVPTTRL